MKKIIAAAAVSLFLSPAAFAAGTSTSAQGIPDDWNTQIKNAFFSDPATGTLRSQSEIKDNWSNLSSDQQAKVKSDCSNMQANAGSTDSTSGSSSDKMTTGSTSTSDNSASSGTSGTSSATSSGDKMASVQKVCDWVKNM